MKTLPASLLVSLIFLAGCASAPPEMTVQAVATCPTIAPRQALPQEVTSLSFVDRIETFLEGQLGQTLREKTPNTSSAKPPELTSYALPTKSSRLTMTQ